MIFREDTRSAKCIAVDEVLLYVNVGAGSLGRVLAWSEKSQENGGGGSVLRSGNTACDFFRLISYTGILSLYLMKTIKQ